MSISSACFFIQPSSLWVRRSFSSSLSSSRAKFTRSLTAPRKRSEIGNSGRSSAEKRSKKLNWINCRPKLRAPTPLQSLVQLHIAFDLARLHKHHGDAMFIGTSCASRAMHIVFTSAWHLVVYDMLHIWYIQTTSCHIGCYEKPNWTVSKSL